MTHETWLVYPVKSTGTEQLHVGSGTIKPDMTTQSLKNNIIDNNSERVGIWSHGEELMIEYIIKHVEFHKWIGTCLIDKFGHTTMC